MADGHRCDRLDGVAAWLRHALRRDLAAIVDLWVDAFADDPYLRWIQPDDQLWPAFGNGWMRFIADLVFERATPM